MKYNITVQDFSPLVSYTNISEWRDHPLDPARQQYYLPSHHSTNVTDAQVKFAFNGTGIYVIGSKGPTHGRYRVQWVVNAMSTFFPDTTFEDFDGYAETVQLETIMFSALGLDQTVPHSVSLNNVNGELDIDYFIVESEVPDGTTEKFIDETDPAFSYQGGWSTNTVNISSEVPAEYLPLAYGHGNTSKSTSEPDAQVNISFVGNGLAVYGSYMSGGFIAQLDDRPGVSVQKDYKNTAGIYRRPKTLLYHVSGLEEREHSLTLINTPIVGALGGNLDIDFAVVTSSGTFTASSSRNNTSNTNNTPIIVGIVVGVVAFLALVAGGLFWFRKLRARRQGEEQQRRDLDLMAEAEARPLHLPPNTTNGQTTTHASGNDPSTPGHSNISLGSAGISYQPAHHG